MVQREERGRNVDVTRGSRWFQIKAEPRNWEQFYKGRWEYDKVVRCSHGVNCSGSCSWQVFVKDGLVCWELQNIDYPQIDADIPNYEPRGCQRGMSTSWYLYSPLRLKYPYVRGILWDLYSQAKAQGRNPVEAWASIVESPEKAKRYKKARGKGGWKRVTWDEAAELVSSSLIYTLRKYGPDRVAAFSPIPAMSMVSFTSGMRFASLLGGTILSFYEWYNDLPTASPECYGEQTDVHESGDWYRASYWIIPGSSLPTTRTPDAHFMSEAKYNGTKVVIVSPDYYDQVKFADTWVQLKPGSDSAFGVAMGHVVLKEFYVDRKVSYFDDYVKRFTNLPFLVTLEKKEGGYYLPKRFLRAASIPEYSEEELAEWKLLLLDAGTKGLRLPKGSIGFRWDREPGHWNLKMEDAVTDEPIDPALTLLGLEDTRVPVAFANFDDTYDMEPTGREGRSSEVVREVPAKVIKTKEGEVLVTTAFDLLVAHLGVSRGLKGDYPVDYNDPKPYTPAWQEKYTGISRDVAIRIGREFAENAEKTKGRSLVIMGPGIQHWYHQDLNYKGYILLCWLCGCVGKNGGGWCHYVGTEKIRNHAATLSIAFSHDWVVPTRFMNSTSYWYFHTGQWKYDAMTLDAQLAPWAKQMKNYRHPADMTALAVRSGWLPFYPTFNKSSLAIVEEAQRAGAKTEAEIVDYVTKEVKAGRISFAVEDPDAPENSPKVLFVWRGNLIGTSMRGHYHALKTLLGTHHNVLGKEKAKDLVKDIKWREPTPEGKLDLFVDSDFRMCSSANYADVLLPPAHWYEKFDLTCTELHSFIHPFTPATDPYWEAKHDWDTFKFLSQKFSEMAKQYFPNPVKDLVAHALLHDTPQELAQPWGDIKDWKRGEVDFIPGKTGPVLRVVERDYTQNYEMYTKLGARIRETFGTKGVSFPLGEIYDGLKKNQLIGEKNGYPSLEMPKQVAETILRISPETDGEVSYKAWKSVEKRMGLELTDLVEHRRHERYSFDDIISQPRRVMNSPMWSGIEGTGRTYSPYTVNIDKLVPFRTLSGRQDIFIDHEVYLELGESLPTFKPPVDQIATKDVLKDSLEPGSKLFRFITPHPKWAIHTTFWDNLRMLNLHRGGQHVFLNPQDAAEIGVEDNDWVEIYTEHGIMAPRAATSHRVPRGMAILYHGSERNIAVPLSKLAQEKGASDLAGGNNNANTRILQNPAWMVGGYAQFSYQLNYWGTGPSERDIVVAIRRMPLAKGEKVRYASPQRSAAAGMEVVG